MIGVLAVQKSTSESFFTLRDLGLLQAIARLSAGLRPSSRPADLAHSATVDGGRVVASHLARVREALP